jgi:hypothetical protein
MHLLAEPLRRCYPDFSERLIGMAQGAGVGTGLPYLLNALEPLMTYLGGVTACPGACSAVAVCGRRSATGETMVARNFDYLPLVQPLYVMRECRPKSGFRSLEFTSAPLVGAVDGMNECGLCITYNYAYTVDSTTETTVPISVLIGETLQRCKNVAEATEWIGRRPRWGGGILMLADASGDIASMEVSAGRSCVRRPRGNDDFLFHTNDLWTPQMRAVQIPDNAVLTSAAPTSLRGQRVHESSESRNRRFLELLTATPVIDAERLSVIMADHGPDGVGSKNTPCMHSCYWNTTACLQFYPRQRRIRFAYTSACKTIGCGNVFREVAL